MRPSCLPRLPDAREQAMATVLGMQHTRAASSKHVVLKRGPITQPQHPMNMGSRAHSDPNANGSARMPQWSRRGAGIIPLIVHC